MENIPINNENLKEQISFSPSDLLSVIDGIPIPPAIKKSLLKSIGRLITGLVDVPVAYLEAKTQQIQSEANALTLITKSAAEAVAFEFGKDKFLIDRTISHFGSKLLREQINRENTVQLAIDDIKANPPQEDSKEEIDSDWLEMFSRIAETKSNEEVQLVLSKILAGEIRKPGSFGPKTIQTLSILDQNSAKIFQLFCSISFEVPLMGESSICVICEPFGSPGNNGLASLGLSYSNLTQLQDAGLIKHDLTSWRQMSPIIFGLPILLGDKSFTHRITSEFVIKNHSKPEDFPKVNIINFTTVGLELRKVIQISSNQNYIEKFESWLKDKFQIE